MVVVLYCGSKYPETTPIRIYYQVYGGAKLDRIITSALPVLYEAAGKTPRTKVNDEAWRSVQIPGGDGIDFRSTCIEDKSSYNSPDKQGPVFHLGVCLFCRNPPPSQDGS